MKKGADMTVLEIKKHLHNLIDAMENEVVLANFYEVMKKKATTPDGQLWTTLTNEERNELLQAADESELAENLIENEEMKKKYKNWL
jgi:TRAP-type C4-dicarboxylate transport system substrate-binding protein